MYLFVFLIKARAQQEPIVPWFNKSNWAYYMSYFKKKQRALQMQATEDPLSEKTKKKGEKRRRKNSN